MLEKTIKLVLADNNRDLCKVLAEHISLQPDLQLVGIAYDGLKALELLEEFAPDVLILDITMPYLDGIGVMERLQSLRLPKKPKVIILTAFEQEAMIKRLLEMGADYYVVKPFDVNILFSRIRQFCEPTGIQVQTTMMKEETLPESGTAGQESEHFLEMKVTKLLHDMGIPVHLRGYAYLREAIVMAVRNIELIGNITKNLYPQLAEKYQTSCSGVESAIRHTIELGWQRGNKKYLEEFFAFSQKDQGEKFLTTSFFIAKIADKLRVELRLE
ncbi:MAG: sporulation transcription factor Spo0A [Bacillota bacterium]